MASTSNQHRPFRLPGEPQEDFEARMAEHAAQVGLRDPRVEHVASPHRGPNWQSPHEPRKAEPKAPRDHFAEARAVLTGADQRDPIIAAVIVAQALDRLTDKIIEAAAVSSYKRSP